LKTEPRLTLRDTVCTELLAAKHAELADLVKYEVKWAVVAGLHVASRAFTYVTTRLLLLLLFSSSLQHLLLLVLKL
jgi:hypothetical protein